MTAMPNVEKISIASTAEMAATVRDAVNSGEYVSTSEVVREALREWKLRHKFRREEIEELRKAWQDGLHSGPGRFADIDAVKAESKGGVAEAEPPGCGSAGFKRSRAPLPADQFNNSK